MTDNRDEQSIFDCLVNLTNGYQAYPMLGNFLDNFYFKMDREQEQTALSHYPREIAALDTSAYWTIYFVALAEQLAYDFELVQPDWTGRYPNALPTANFGGGENGLTHSHKDPSQCLRLFAKRNIYIIENDLSRNGQYPRTRLAENGTDTCTYRGKELDGDYRIDFMPKQLSRLMKSGQLVMTEQDIEKQYLRSYGPAVWEKAKNNFSYA